MDYPINEGIDKCIYLGNLDSLRDWGHKRLCRNAMEDVTTKNPKDYVATGKQVSVRKFIEISANILGWEVC